jgi:hypothetical protein
MSITGAFRPLVVAALMAFAAVTPAFAQAEDPDDPPGRVGRLSHIEGTVSFRNAEEDQWVPATLNFPVTTGDSFWTEPGARAEIQIGSTDLRLDPATAIDVARLDDATTQIQLDQGSINLRVRELPPGGVRIVTPRATVELLQPGRYHVDAVPSQGSSLNDNMRVAVLEGLARIEGAEVGAPLTVSAGHSATLRDTAPPLLAQAIARPLDDWALRRERLLNPQETVRYVSPEMTGYQDLDRYGQWGSDPNYGAVWYPRATVVDWAPYRYGHWAYVRPWGWTWIDEQPWGFAPFHYGRWVRVRDRWGWCPGERVRRPVYAPALVAFVGGSNFVVLSSGRRAPAVGWVPLGPREAFRPHYRHSPAYVRNVNITTVNVTNVTVVNRDRDRDRDGDSVRSFRNRDSMTVVSNAAFTGAAPVAKTRVALRDSDVGDARRTESLDHLQPSRAAKAGILVPAAATAGNRDVPATEPRQRSRRSDRDDDRIAPPTARTTNSAPPTARTNSASPAARDANSAPPTANATSSAPAARGDASVANNPDVLPKAPGPTRDPRSARSNGREGSQQPVTGQPVTNQPGARQPASQSREPAATPFERPDRAAPALRPAEAPLRTPAPPGRASGMEANRPADPPGRVSNPAPRDQGDGRSRNQANQPRPDERRAVEPSTTPRALTPSQQPGTAPNTVAPSRPAPIQASPAPMNQPNAARPDSERARRDTNSRDAGPGARAVEPTREPQRIAPSRPVESGAIAPRSLPPGREPATQGSQRPPGRPAEIAPQQRVAPPVSQPRREERDTRREPARESPVMRAPAPAPQQPSRPAPQQNLERRPQPQSQRIEPRPEPRREARPQPSAPREMAPRRNEPAPRAQPQEAQRPNNGRKPDEQRRNGG